MSHTVKQLLLKVSGMTCSSCERRIEAAISRVEGVLSVTADQARSSVKVDFDGDRLSHEQTVASIKVAAKNAGYLVKGELQSAQGPSLAVVLAIAAAMIGAFLLINSQGWFNFLPTIDASVGLGMIFVAGLLTSVHCVAMCGGIALSQQATFIGEPQSPGDSPSRAKASLRGLQYHAGRVVSYTLLGAVVGALGSVISFSPATRGILAAIAGLFMVVIGLRMLGLLPNLPKLRLPQLQRIISPKIIRALRGRGSFFVGLLNGFMPCGPLQTMQLYALGTGSAVMGALSMLLFSLGTVPLMFAFGALSGFFTARWQVRLVRASSILVVFFGVLMLGRALDMSGASGMIQTLVSRITGSGDSIPQLGATNDASSTVATIKDGFQYVSFDLQPGSYAPITVQKGIPVKWTINATDDNLNGCNGEVQVPVLGLKKKLLVGANLIEFTPESTGIISYTCWMGMISSTIRVVDTLAASPTPAAQNLATNVSDMQGAPGAGKSAAGCGMACCSP